MQKISVVMHEASMKSVIIINVIEKNTQTLKLNVCINCAIKIVQIQHIVHVCLLNHVHHI